MKLLSLFFLAIPLALIARFFDFPNVFVFIFAALSFIPLAAVLGEATEELAARLGQRAGGLLNATFGNLVELTIAIFAIKAGLIDLAKASLTGSILGNLLFVAGLSFIVGGAKWGIQKFNRYVSGMNVAMLVLTLMAVMIPTVFSLFITQMETDIISLGTAFILFIAYLFSLLFLFTTKELKFTKSLSATVEKEEISSLTFFNWTPRTAIVTLFFATILIALMSEIFIGSVGGVISTFGVSEIFLGLFLVPLVGNVAENFVCVTAAIENKMDLSLTVSHGSALQVAMFVIPIVVFASFLLGNPMNLVFTVPALVALAAGGLITGFVVTEGESDWFEGVQLLAIYAILALAFWFI